MHISTRNFETSFRSIGSREPIHDGSTILSKPVTFVAAVRDTRAPPTNERVQREIDRTAEKKKDEEASFDGRRDVITRHGRTEQVEPGKGRLRVEMS